MYFVYVLQSVQNPKQFYFGQTNDLKNRLSQHNEGRNASTKAYRPWKLVYFEGYSSRSVAMQREKQLKHYGQARTALKKRLKLF
jgi:putative endonuclease